MDSIVSGKMDQYGIPGLAIGLVKNDAVIYTKGYGTAKIGSDMLVSGRSIFHTASISKLFTAMAVMKLAEEKRISINDTLADLLPGLNYRDERTKKITIKQLLNHSSGLPDIRNYHWKKNRRSENSLREYVTGLNLKASSEPASEYQYSNLAYDILGYVIEVVSGVPFEDYVKDHILDPCGMYDSDFRYFQISDSLKVAPHSKRWITDRIYARKTYPYTREHAPSSTLNASGNDLAKWMVCFLRMLKDKSSGSLYRAMVEPSFEAYPNIGLGFQLFRFEAHRAIGHFGGDQGFRSFLMMIPEKDIGLVVLGNCDYHEDYRQEIVRPVAKLMLAKKWGF